MGNSVSATVAALGVTGMLGYRGWVGRAPTPLLGSGFPEAPDQLCVCPCSVSSLVQRLPG